MIDPVEAAFRAHMRALAPKGGAATKQRHGCDPRYYRRVGRLGGQASVAARRARIAAELDRVEPGESPVVAPSAACAEDPPSPTRTTTIREIMADSERARRCAPDVSHRQQQSMEDCLAEESFARFLAQPQQRSEDPEPWDRWS